MLFLHVFNIRKNFIEEPQLPLAWKVAFQCMSVNIKDQSEGIQVMTDEKVQVEANSSCMILCAHSDFKWNSDAYMMVDGSDLTSLPGGLFVTPMVVPGKAADGNFPVMVVNCSQRTIHIPAKTVVGNVVPVTLASTSVDMGNEVIPSKDIMEMFPLEHLTSEERHRVHQCLEKHRKAFSWNSLDLGHCSAYKHRIRLTDDTPFKERYRRIPPAMVDEVRSHLQEMLDSGVIQESKSPFSSPAVFVRKRDGSLRFVIDFRRLNEKTVPDAHYLPRIDDTFDRLAGSSWFSTLDLKAGYWQVEMEPDDRKFTAFTAGTLGFF